MFQFGVIPTHSLLRTGKRGVGNHFAVYARKDEDSTVGSIKTKPT